MNRKPTLSDRISVLEVGFAEMQETNQQILALLRSSSKAKTVTRKAPKAPAKPAPVAVKVTSGHQFTGERVVNGTRKLTRNNRKAFIAAHGWATAGMSCSDLRNWVANGAKVNKGWNVAI